MSKNWLKIIFLVLCTTLGFAPKSSAQHHKEHIEVALRNIGHQLLLNADDRTSIVRPIETVGNKFKINFESAFPFSPEKLITTVDSIFDIANIDEGYRLEVENTDLNEVIYNYEVLPSDTDLISCFQRAQPKANYSVLVSFLNDRGEVISFKEQPQENHVVAEKKSSSKGLISILILVLIVITLGVYFWRIKGREKDNGSNIRIGKYRFDQRNMKLIYKKESIDLTSKETDLLTLLHSSMDETIERERILEVVWGDEGDYVGRTLDVFISKLRKKFSEDENVKIVNIRGVGYKLMLSQIG